MTPPAPILVGQVGNLLWLRVEGKGSFQNSVQVKRCFQAMMEKGFQHFVVDLERCPIMDSTFLGTLTGAALNLQTKTDNKGVVCIINANARNQQLLTSLGLDHILDVDTEGTRYAKEREEIRSELDIIPDFASSAPDKTEQAQHVLSAHEALTQANAQNATRFKDVIEFLEKELRANTGV